MKLSACLKSPYFYFGVGLVVRGIFLLYNLSWHLAPEWTRLTQASLVAAELIAGKLPSLDFPHQEAMELFRTTDRGTALAHLFLIKIFGSSSLLSLRVVNLILDSAMVLVCFRIGKILGGERLARFSALAYAFFPPAVFICINPFWYAWLAAGALLCTWLVLEMAVMDQAKTKRFFVHAFFLLLTGTVIAQFRSTFVFYLFFLGIWLLIASLVLKRSLPPNLRRLVLVLLLAGVFNIASGSLMNKILYGGGEPMRSDFGHVMWVGFGEFANPMGIVAEDSSVGNYYAKMTGHSYSGLTSADWKDYNSWLFKEGVKFIATHPILYGSMVVRRCLKFIFPNFRISRISDLESFNVYEEKVLGTREARLAVVKSDRLHTLQGLKDLWSIDKSYFFEGALRVILILLLPMLLGFGLWQLGANIPSFLAVSFLAYNLATLGPIRVPDMNLFSVWSAMVPILAAGVLWLWTKLSGKIQLSQSRRIG